MLITVQKCYKQILFKYTGEERCNKLIKFGNFFEREFAPHLAVGYYNQAFECAPTA